MVIESADVVGYRHQDIEREIAALVAQDYIRTVFNEDYEEGNILALNAAW